MVAVQIERWGRGELAEYDLEESDLRCLGGKSGAHKTMVAVSRVVGEVSEEAVTEEVEGRQTRQPCCELESVWIFSGVGTERRCVQGSRRLVPKRKNGNQPGIRVVVVRTRSNSGPEAMTLQSRSQGVETRVWPERRRS